MNLKRAFLLSLVLYCGSLIASDYYAGYEWVRSARPPLVPQWHAVGSQDVQANCRHGRNAWFNACSVYDLRGGICHVYASQSEMDSPAWLRWHEQLHCAGWDHN